MDRKTFLNFIIISALIILGWELVTRTFGPAPVPVEPPPASEAPPPAPEAEVVDEYVEEAVEPEETEVGIAKGLVLENSRIRTEWTNRGAGLQSLKLLQYSAPYFGENGPSGGERPVLRLLGEIHDGVYSDVIESITFISVTHEGISRRRISLDEHVYEVAEHGPGSILFRTTLEGRLEIRKKVRLEPDSYHYGVELELRNLSDENVELEYALRTAAGIEREMLRTRYLSTVVAVRDGDRLNINLTAPGDIEGHQFNESTNIAWAGLVSQYFMAALWPDSPEWIQKVESRRLIESGIREGTGRWSYLRGENADPARLSKLASDNPNIAAVIHSRPDTMPPGAIIGRRYRFIAVPLLSDILDSYASGLSADIRSGRMPFFTRVLSLGTIGFLVPLMVRILDFFHSLIPNYGVAILLLTLLIRGALHPLTRSSQVSMLKMKKLQPHLQDLMKKYGDDRQRLAQEQWKLYSSYGVHPMKGCFPMLPQMPVFLALFKTLRTSVQLRQAVFIPGWITDLSQPDTVWEMPFSLPVIGSNLNILPVIMVGAWMLNQQMTPMPADPKAQQQQKIMKWMPVIFAFMFYNFASGLLLYITFSSFLGAFEHWLIRKQAADIELVPLDRAEKEKKKAQRQGKAPVHGAAADAGKKGWLRRLLDAEEMKQKNSRQLYRKKDKKR